MDRWTKAAHGVWVRLDAKGEPWMVETFRSNLEASLEDAAEYAAAPLTVVGRWHDTGFGAMRARVRVSADV